MEVLGPGSFCFCSSDLSHGALNVEEGQHVGMSVVLQVVYRYWSLPAI
jgi:hypothetical protein